MNPDLVVRDKDGEIYTVRYEAVNVMLLNEFLKEIKELKEEQANNQRPTLNSDQATEAAYNCQCTAQSAGRSNPKGERTH